MGNWLLDIFKSARKDNILRIEVYDKYISINEQLIHHEKLISVTTVNKIFEGIDKDLPRVEIADIFIKNQHMLRIGCSSFMYKDVLRLTLDKLSKHEQYELCYKTLEYIELLEKKSKKYLVE